jgi:hypothetical protein
MGLDTKQEQSWKAVPARHPIKEMYACPGAAGSFADFLSAVSLAEPKAVGPRGVKVLGDPILTGMKTRRSQYRRLLRRALCLSYGKLLKVVGDVSPFLRGFFCKRAGESGRQINGNSHKAIIADFGLLCVCRSTQKRGGVNFAQIYVAEAENPKE